jgi:hypothetical protein
MTYLSTVLFTLTLVAGHVYNATLDPWNINKNQSEPASSPVVFMLMPRRYFINPRIHHGASEHHLHPLAIKLARESQWPRNLLISVAALLHPPT